MTIAGANPAIDLVCGPDGPLPEGRQRYRLVGRLGSGGQADVFRGVRLSHGVSSAPVTVKVFRASNTRPVLDQMRSWDKGDAVLMDLNTRKVPGICLRVDGFYGAPPVRPDATAVLGANTEQRIPYQVLDYLPGRTLLQHVAAQAQARGGPAPDGEPLPRLNGVAVLSALAHTIDLLHNPTERGESAVLHMDVKPSNVLVLPSGEIRLIDFTGARYHDPVHITTIAHTPESAGPEAFTGQVGPAYDVHGFGAVAYHLVTGWLPRADRATPHYDGEIAVPGALRRHPLLDQNPALAAHLLAPLDDNPANRPRTVELRSWVTTLAHLAVRLPQAGVHVDWNDPGRGGHQATAVVGRAPDQTRVAPATRVERMAGAALGGASTGAAASARSARPHGAAGAPGPHAGGRGGGSSSAAAVTAGGAGQRPGEPPAPRIPSGVAKVVPRQPRPAQDDWPDDGGSGYPPAHPDKSGRSPAPEPAGPLRRRGKGFTTFAVVVAAACWLLWLTTVVVLRNANTVEPLIALGLVAIGALGAWWLVRLGDHLIRVTLDRGGRSGTLVQNIVTGVFILLCATVFLTRAQGNFDDVGHQISEWWSSLWDSVWPF